MVDQGDDEDASYQYFPGEDLQEGEEVVAISQVLKQVPAAAAGLGVGGESGDLQRLVVPPTTLTHSPLQNV